MGRNRYEPFVQFKKTLLDMRNRWPWLLGIIAIDLAFITVFSFVYTLYFSKIVTHVNVILQQTPQVTGALQSQDIYSAMPFVQTISEQIFEIKKIAFILAVSSLVIWIGFQAYNWCNCFRVSGKKISYLNYLKPFSVLSIIWTAIISLILYISIQMFFGNAMSFSGSPDNPGILNIGILMAFLIVGYFALVSYSLKGTVKEVLSKTVVFSFLKSKVLVSYLFIIASAGIINFIILLLFKISSILAFIIGFILVLLLFIFARVYMINVVQDLDNKKDRKSKIKKKKRKS